ncbi:MAG: hypothetical protein JW395_0557 [Nitrospira sp.]|nr:hypothetical protein [Nitrospira sp.]
MTKLAHSYSAIKMFENCPKQYYEVRITKKWRDRGGTASIFGDRVHKDLEARLKKTAPLTPETSKYEKLCAAFERIPGELKTEQEMTLNESLTPTGWWSGDAWLRSKLDVLVLNGATAIVADWKTGKHRPDFSQLELFALQTFKHYPEITTVRSTFVWLKDDLLDKQTYTRTDEPKLWDKLLTRIKRIEGAVETGVWPAKPSGLCGFCPVMNCEHRRH